MRRSSARSSSSIPSLVKMRFSRAEVAQAPTDGDGRLLLVAQLPIVENLEGDETMEEGEEFRPEVPELGSRVNEPESANLWELDRGENVDQIGGIELAG